MIYENNILAPNVAVGFQGDTLYVGFGSLQQKITDQRFQHYILKILKFLKHQRTLTDISKYIHNDISANNEDQKFLVKFLTENNFLIPEGIYNKSERYSRSFLYYALSGGNPLKIQEKLENSHVVILGCGGIGNIVSALLATSGIGQLTLIDEDNIELSNLTRQILFSMNDCGNSKVQILKTALESRNNEIKINTICEKISGNNLQILDDADLIVLSADETNCLELVNNYCIKEGISYISAGYVQDVAVWGPFVIPGKTGCFYCQDNVVNDISLPPEFKEMVEAINRGHQAPSIGPINMIAASHATLDVIKYLGQFGTIQSMNKRLGVWTHDLKIEEQSCNKNENCVVCGTPA